MVNIAIGVLPGKVDKYCYLGYMLAVNVKCDSAVTRVRVAWEKFHESYPY